MGGTLSKNRFAIILMAAAMTFLAANDAVLKHVGASMPVGQMMVVRGIALVAFLYAGCRLGSQEVTLASLVHRWSISRGIGEICATYLFIYSLTILPIAVATTIVFCFPIFLTALSGPLFGERVGIWRWTAVIVGFLGVLVVTAPGTDAWQWVYLMPLGAAVFVTLRDVSTRYVAPHISSGSVTMTTAIAVIIAGLFSIPFGWIPLTGSSVSWLTLCAALIGISFFTYVLAVRTGELSLIAPVQYVVILWALFFGGVFWGEAPGLRELCGGAMIIFSGLLILYRERVQHSRQQQSEREAAGQ
ncbi:MAG: DMT family transporter [Pseudomonadota bacterium]